jgi:hypothetical protein
MKKLQFFVCYTLSGLSPNNNISTAIDVTVFNTDSATQKSKDILNAIVFGHNNTSLLVNNYGYINSDRIIITNLTRLD